MRGLTAVAVFSVACGAGCFSGPRYGAGLAVQVVSPNDDALERSTQVDVLGRVVFDTDSVELSYGRRSFAYSRTEGATTYAGDIDFAPLAVSWQHLFGAQDSQLRVGLGLGFIVLTGATESVTNVTGIDAGSAWKFVLGLQYAPADAFSLAIEVPYEFNTQDVTLEKPGYQGVNLDAPVVRVSGAYLF